MKSSAVLSDVLARAVAEAPAEKIGILICFSHLRWDFVFQRPQHLLTRAARDHLVAFVEEPHFDARERAELEIARRGDVLLVTPHLCVGRGFADAEADQRELITDLQKALVALLPDTEVIHWYYTPMALGFAAELPSDVCVYDCMDELSAFRGAPPALLERETQLFERADLVFTGGRSLYEAKKNRHHAAHLFPSSIDGDHFMQARESIEDPPDQKSIPHPRVGFFGVIDERMDLDLVAQIAERAPEWQLIMIGPVVKIDPAALPQRANIHWIGGRSYQELPAYLSGWQLGFMPFALNESTRFISPTKTPEFLAAGLPLISTAVKDVVRPYGDSGLVQIIDSAEQAVACGNRLLLDGSNTRLQAVDKFLSGISWDLTWAGMHKLLAAKLSAKQLPAGDQLSTEREIRDISREGVLSV